MRVIGLIPARAGSQRVKHKNIRPFTINGQTHSLTVWAILRALESYVFEEVVVSTDDPLIMDLASQHGARVVERPSELATATSPDIEWVNHAVESVGWKGDAFSILRPTSPFRSAETIRRAWEQFQGMNVDSIRAVEPISQRPEKMWRLVDNQASRNGSAWSGAASLGMARQGEAWHGMVPYLGEWVDWVDPGEKPPLHSRQSSTFEPLFIQTATIEIAHTHVLPETISGDRVGAFFTEDLEGIDINTPEDLRYAQWLANEASELLEDSA